MIDLHDQFLTDNASAEMKARLVKAYDILISLNNPDLDANLEELIMLDHTVETGVTITRISNLFSDLQYSLLQQHDVYMTDEVPLAITTHLLMGILALPDYENMSAIYQIAANDQDPEETFVQVMELLTPYKADNLIMQIESVGSAVVRRLLEIAGTREEEIITDEERMARAKYVGKVNRFCHYTRSRDYRMIELMQDGWSVGYPYTVYADEVGRGFEGLVPEAIAKEMTIMALASSDGSNNPLGVIKPNLEKYISSINVITKVDIEVSRLLQGFDHG